MNDKIEHDEERALEEFENIANRLKKEQDNIIKKTLDDDEEEGSVRKGILKNAYEIALERGRDYFYWVYYVFFYAYFIVFILNFIRSYMQLDIALLGFSTTALILNIVVPLLLWAIQSNSTSFNYHSIKIFTFCSIIAYVILRLTSLVYYVAFIYIVPMIMKFNITEKITANKILGLAYFVLAFFIVVPMVILFGLFIHWYNQGHEGKKGVIENFMFNHYFSLYNGKYRYDMTIMNDMKTGKTICVKEKSRFEHFDILGATGTGKSSMVILPAIYYDFAKRAFILKKLKKITKLYVKKGYLYIKEPFSDTSFSLNYFAPTKGHEHRYKKLHEKYRLLGMTVVAPGDDLTDKVAEIAELFGFSYNRLDPLPDMEINTGQLKKNAVGFNILYISPEIPDWRKPMEMTKKATLLADVMQKLFERGGKSDPFFDSINRIATTTISMLLMLTYPILNEGKHPTLEDIQTLLNDFLSIQIYYNVLRLVDTKMEYLAYLSILENNFGCKNEPLKYDLETLIKKHKEQKPDHGYSPPPEVDRFSPVVKFREHCSGIRVQFDNLLANPLIKRVLCSRDLEPIDLDKMLYNSEITICNIALGELGTNNSPAFGLLFSNSFIDAVLRRPGTEKTREPHLWYIDEFPIIASPSFESCFSLFRKYRVGMIVALQTLDQMEKDNFLKYLKGILLNSCSHHAVFGRANVGDMKIFSDMSGVERSEFSQKSYSHNSVWSENPNFSESVRTTPEIKANTESSDIRYKNFSELTFFTSENGNPVRPIHAKVHFLKKSQWKKKKMYSVSWEDYYKIKKNEVETKTNDMDVLEDNSCDDILIGAGLSNTFDDVFKVTSESEIVENRKSEEEIVGTENQKMEENTAIMDQEEEYAVISDFEDQLREF